MIAKVQVDYNLYFFFSLNTLLNFLHQNQFQIIYVQTAYVSPEPFLLNIFMKTVAIWCTLAQITDI